MKLIDDWKDAWRFSSVWASGAGLLTATIDFTQPEFLIALINVMPQSILNLLPNVPFVVVAGGIYGLTILSRVIEQPKVAEVQREREGIVKVNG